MLYRANARLLVMLSGLEISIWSGQVCNRSFRITVSRKISQALAHRVLLKSMMSYSSVPETLSPVANPKDIVNRGHIPAAKPVCS